VVGASVGAFIAAVLVLHVWYAGALREGVLALAATPPSLATSSDEMSGASVGSRPMEVSRRRVSKPRASHEPRIAS
jgi:hypothetical protein